MPDLAARWRTTGPSTAQAGQGQSALAGRFNDGGQPPFVPTNEQRTKVMKLVACGFTRSVSVIMAIPEQPSIGTSRGS
jgi:hypothetical protein